MKDKKQPDRNEDIRDASAGAIASPEVCIVEASAGSGKTYALATRYLKLIFDPRYPIDYVPLRAILAITFTNKAMIEMKERILEFLKKIALDAFSGPEEKTALLEEIGAEEEFARRKASRVMDALIAGYNFFQVQTIDSFINALLLGSALNIDRSASFIIKRDYLEPLAYCLDLTIEYAASNKEVFAFLDEFLEHYLFVENRNGWFPKRDILELVQSLFQLRNKYGRPFKLYEGESSDVISRKRYLFKKIVSLCDSFPQGINAAASRHIASFVEKSNDIFDIPDLPAALKKEYPPMNKGKVCPGEFALLWEETYRDLRGLIELDARVAYKPYIKLFNSLISFFQAISKKDDVLFLEELNRTARLLFGREGITVAELYYRLATRFRHYLIDEFQDTSDLQWRNLEMMIEEALSTGGSLFYVGDKKQAIYRFRGGEVRLFDQVRDRFSDFNLKLTSLTRNWRSQKAIVEFNNSVFSRDNLGKALNNTSIAEELENDTAVLGQILDIFKDARQKHRKGKDRGYVYVERIDEKNQTERDELMQPKIVKLVRDLRARGFRHQDIALLTRNNNEVELVTSWLLRENIPVESEKTLNVLENPLVKELISFLTFLHSPIDDLQFASFILGDLFSAASGISGLEIRDFLFDLHCEKKSEESGSLYRLFRESYPRAWEECVSPFFKSTGFISPYELVASIYQRLAVFDRFPESLAFFMKFIELIKVKEDECVGLEEFLAYLPSASPDELYVSVAHSDSVKILTVHKAKGLEFPVVIVPFLRLDITPESGGKSTSSYIEDEDGPELGLLRITKTHREYSPFLREVYSRSFLKACIDELNNVYVALTRAETELYLYIPKKSGAKNNLARAFIPENISEAGLKPDKIKCGQEQDKPLIDLKAPGFRDWIDVLHDEFQDSGSLKNRENIKRGTILHGILSFIKQADKMMQDEVVAEALARIEADYPLVREDGFYRKKIIEILDSEKTAAFFSVSDGEVWCEKEIVDSSGDTKRLDRLIVKDKEVWVIDYKSSREGEEKQRAQVREYLRLVSALYPGRAIKGFILYMDELSVEQI